MFESYVYFITDDHGHIKIGKANNVWSRMLELQTGNPYKLRLLLSVGMSSENEAFELEQALHRLLWQERMEGEWFHAQPVLELIGKDIVSVGNYQFYGRPMLLEEVYA